MSKTTKNSVSRPIEVGLEALKISREIVEVYPKLVSLALAGVLSNIIVLGFLSDRIPRLTTLPGEKPSAKKKRAFDRSVEPPTPPEISAEMAKFLRDKENTPPIQADYFAADGAKKKEIQLLEMLGYKAYESNAELLADHRNGILVEVKSDESISVRGNIAKSENLHLRLMTPEAYRLLKEIAVAFKKASGSALPVTSLSRSKEYIIDELSKKNGNSTPDGKSAHRFGVVVDLPRGVLSEMGADVESGVLRLLSKYRDAKQLYVILEKNGSLHFSFFIPKSNTIAVVNKMKSPTPTPEKTKKPDQKNNKSRK